MKITSIIIHASIDGKKELHEVLLDEQQMKAVIETIGALNEGTVKLKEEPSSIIELNLQEMERLRTENDNLKRAIRHKDRILEAGGNIV